jgi:CBS domain-containing protein
VQDLLEGKSKGIFTIEQSSSVADAVGQMADHQVGSLIVVDKGRPVGMFTERDVLKAWVKRTRADDTRFRDIPLVSVMTPDPIVANPGDSLDYVVSVMIKKKIRHIPIVEGHSVVGVLSMRDVVQTLVTNLKVEIHHLLETLATKE